VYCEVRFSTDRAIEEDHLALRLVRSGVSAGMRAPARGSHEACSQKSGIDVKDLGCVFPKDRSLIGGA